MFVMNIDRLAPLAHLTNRIGLQKHPLLFDVDAQLLLHGCGDSVDRPYRSLSRPKLALLTWNAGPKCEAFFLCLHFVCWVGHQALESVQTSFSGCRLTMSYPPTFVFVSVRLSAL